VEDYQIIRIIFLYLFKFVIEYVMLIKIIASILLSAIVYSQQQVDIPWPTLADSPWPMIKHDPQFTGRSPYKGPESAKVLWNKAMNNGGIFSGPVMGEDNNLYFGSYYIHSDSFYSYCPKGTLRWVYETSTNRAPAAGILVDSSNTIYFGSRDSCVYALNPNGTLKWKYRTTGQIVQEIIPNIDLQGNIYVTNFLFEPSQPDKGELYSIKPDGTLNWKVMFNNGFAFKSPVISPDGNTIYIAGVDSNLFALNLDGSLKWKFSCGNILRAPMVDSNGNIYFIPTPVPAILYSIFPDGNIRWVYQLPLGGFFYAIPTIDSKGNVYAIARDSNCCPYYPMLISLNYNGGLRWTYLFDIEESDDFEQPLICDSEGTVYVGSTYGSGYYAISSEGELKWHLPLLGLLQQVDNTGSIGEDGTLYLGVHEVSTIPPLDQITLMAIRDTVTSVKDANENMVSYKLEQNYPNPFNSSTNIKYAISQSSRVSIKVFDLMGKEVATLLNRYQQAGRYDIIFQANDLASGIYFYSLRSGDFVATKKLILLK
jgi:outer membrane protein assembly factor BamB